MFSAPDCPYCDEAKAALRDAGLAFTEVSASDWQRAQLTTRTGSRTVPQVFAGGEFVGGCRDGGLAAPFRSPHGLLQAMAARAAGARDRRSPARRRDGAVSSAPSRRPRPSRARGRRRRAARGGGSSPPRRDAQT